MQTTIVPLSGFMTTLWLLVGILVSLILPVAVKILRAASSLDKRNPPTFWQRIKAAWAQYGGNKYLTIFLAAVVVAVALVFLLGLQFFTARDAALAGFAWESLINKLFATQNPPPQPQPAA
jgi:hypothetical protein